MAEMTDDERRQIEHKGALLKHLVYPDPKKPIKDQVASVPVELTLDYPEVFPSGSIKNAVFRLEFSNGTVIAGKLEDAQIYNPRMT